MFILPNMSFNDLVLDEIGLEFHNDFLIDQDSRNQLVFNSRYIIPNSSQLWDKGYYVFNPYKDLKFMNFLFDYFTKKILNEQNIYIDVVYYKPVKNSHNYPLAVRANGREYISKVYNVESLKYLDMICQLNGGTNVDLSRFDAENDT